MAVNNFQSSFIPKTESLTYQDSRRNTDLLSWFTIFCFIGVFVLTIGLFLYNYISKRSIENLKKEVILAESNIDYKNIDLMSSLGYKLTLSKNLINKHRVISSFISLLSNNTLKTIKYSDFSYQFLDSGELEVVLSGDALDYSSIALQEKVFSDINVIKSSKFSNLSLSDKGRVSFRLVIFLDPNSAFYLANEVVEAVEVDDVVGADSLDNDLDNINLDEIYE